MKVEGDLYLFKTKRAAVKFAARVRGKRRYERGHARIACYGPRQRLWSSVWTFADHPEYRRFVRRGFKAGVSILCDSRTGGARGRK